MNDNKRSGRSEPEDTALPLARYAGTELESLAAAENYHRWIVDQFQPFLGENVVEVGAGLGSVSTLLLETQIKRLFAFEPAENLYPDLTRCLHHDPRAVVLNSKFDPSRLSESIDSVVYLNVLEHIPDDHGELARVHAALKPRGYLLVFVPALPWLYSDFDRQVGHYRRYTKRSLCRLVEETGFEVVAVRYFDVVGMIPWYFGFVLLRGRPNQAIVARYDRYFVPVLRCLESCVAPPIGKNLLLIARRP